MKLIRKTLSIVLLAAFLSSTLGIQVYKHYCGNLLADISFFHKSSCCEAEQGESCPLKKEVNSCEDEFQFIQLDTELTNHSVQSIRFEQLAVVQTLFNFTFNLNLSTEVLDVETYKQPPERSKTPLYKRFNRLTLYG